MGHAAHALYSEELDLRTLVLAQELACNRGRACACVHVCSLLYKIAHVISEEGDCI